MAQQHESHHRGQVKDPENDGRLKENRESGHTKGTTPGSEARAHERGREPAESSHSRSHGGESAHGARTSSSHEGSGSAGQHGSGGSDDLKSREYRDSEGNVHHHTRTHGQQHRK